MECAAVHIVDAARIADADGALDEECVLERVQVAAAAAAGAPYLGSVGAYNKRWYVDAVALPHDAARRVLSALFAATSALHTVALDATSRDVELYARLVRESARFLAALLAAEDAALRAAQTTGARRASRRATTPPPARARLVALVATLADVATDAHLTPALRLAARARAALHELATAAQAHFKAKESALPPALRKRFRSSKARTRIEARLLEILAREEGGLRFAALLVCSLSSADVVSDFATRHFPKNAVRKQEFMDARKALFADGGLLHIPVVFEKAAKKYAARFSIERFQKECTKDRSHEELIALVG